MEPGDYLAIWLSDSAAKLFLGLPEPTTESRWCALGTMKGQWPNGVWLDVDAIHEIKGPNNNVVREWGVKPKGCLIRWEFMTHAQLWGTQAPQDKEVGFIQRKGTGSN